MENIRSFFTTSWANAQTAYANTTPTQRYIALAITIAIITGVVVLLVREYQRRAAKQPRFLKDGHIMRQNPTKIEAKKLPILSGENQATYFFWVNIKDYAYKQNEYKPIFQHGQLAILLNAYKNDLCVIALGRKIILVEDIPMKRWVSIAVCINNTNCEIYVNGRLEVSDELGLSMDALKGDVMIGTLYNQTGGFDGVLSNFCYFIEALPVYKIQSLHNGGPWGSNIVERVYYNFFGNTKKIIEFLEKEDTAEVVKK